MFLDSKNTPLINIAEHLRLLADAIEHGDIPVSTALIVLENEAEPTEIRMYGYPLSVRHCAGLFLECATNVNKMAINKEIDHGTEF